MIDSLPLREGYVFLESQESQRRQALALKDNGFITLDKTEFILCRQCDGEVQVTQLFRKMQRTACPTCRRPVALPVKIQKRLVILRVDRSKIIKKIDSVLNSLYPTLVQFDKDRTIWQIESNGKKIPVSLLGISTSASLLLISEGNGCLFCFMDLEKDGGIITDTNRFQFIDFAKFIDQPNIVKEAIEKISLSFKQNYSIALEKEFDELISRLSDTGFEKWVEGFLNALKKQSDDLTKFFSFLNLKRNTVLNMKVVLLGGPGYNDFMIIDLLKYLSDGLKPSKFGEAKKYRKTKFEIDDYGKAIQHSLEDDTLFIVSTNNIQKEVWIKLEEMKRKVGYYKYVIIDRDLILLLISVLKIESILQQRIDD